MSTSPSIADAGRYLLAEAISQPDAWQRIQDEVQQYQPLLPKSGERVAVIGCGSSFYGAQVYAELRESSGAGHSDAFPASEHRLHRGYDRAVMISRSGTTTEVLQAIEDARKLDIPVTTIVATAGTPAAINTPHSIVLPFLDEESVVQSRFATGAVALLRAHLGQDLSPAISAARELIQEDIATALGPLLDAEQITCVGRGWTIGLAHEAALKLRESAQFWSESYPAMEYRHGPMSISGPRRAVWALGEVPEGLGDEVQATGAVFVHHDIDPLTELVRVHLLSVHKARRLGLDPDQPRHLSRSIILSAP